MNATTAILYICFAESGVILHTFSALRVKSYTVCNVYAQKGGFGKGQSCVESKIHQD